ncbi:MAG: M1 family metallopeptidase [Chloroflexi bacterium]|nr:M1 family metallopeptidase [Chloroflexota bacterium]
MRPAFADQLLGIKGAPQYEIEVNLDPDQHLITGQQTVWYTNRTGQPLSEIYFRLLPATPAFGRSMSVTRVRVDEREVQPTLEVQGTALRVPWGTPLEPGASAVFQMRFETATTGRLLLFSRFGQTGNLLELPAFYPLLAVYDEMGWHTEVLPEGQIPAETYAEAAFYQVHITAPSTQVVVTTGSCGPPQPQAEGSKWTCVAGLAREFAIFAASTYQGLSTQVEDATLRFFYTNPLHEDDARLMLASAVQALRVFNRLFGEYPWVELDFVDGFVGHLAIEYPGLVQVGLESYQREPSVQERVIAAHEVAHQWWYNLVGNDQLNHPWLDEALATYSEALYVEEVHGAAAAREWVEGWQRQVGASGACVDQPATAFANFEDYVTVVYHKGALFFDEVRRTAGDAAFFAWLRAYIEANRYGIANGEKLLAAAEVVGQGETVRALYDSWIRCPHSLD